MRDIPKIVKLSFLVILVFLILLSSAAFILQDKVSGIVLATLNRNIATKIEAGTMKLSFIRSFPRASVELRDVVVHSSEGFDKSEFPGKRPDTLLFAHSLYMIFKPTDILRGRYDIESINVRSGNILLLSDKKGIVNYTIATNRERTDTNVFTIDLRKISLTGVSAAYINTSSRFEIHGLIREGKLKSRISGGDIDFSAISGMIIDSVKLKETTITRPLNAAVDLELVSTPQGVTFRKSLLDIDGYKFGVEGSISASNIYDLKITGKDVDISGFLQYLPEKFREKASHYDPSGMLVVYCLIKGPVTKTRNPHTEIDFSLQKGKITYASSRIAMQSISFDGHYSNGNGNRAQTSSVEVKNIKVRLGSTDYSGSFVIRNFDNPVTTGSVKGIIFPAEIKTFFDITAVSEASGSVDADLSFRTAHRYKDKVSVDDILNLQPEGTLMFNDFTLGLAKNNMVFRNVNGPVAVSDVYTTSGLKLEYAGQKIGLKGEFRNLPEWLAGKPVTLRASGDVSFSRLKPEAFFSSDVDKATRKGIEFPGDAILGINFRIDSLEYKTFSSTGITGTLEYKPRLLTFKTLNMKTLHGGISGNGFIVQNSNKSMISRADLTVSSIDIKQAFTTFNNFGQSFIVAGNLSGLLSGSISILLPFDPQFKPKNRELTAEGRFNLINGALINFEPVKKLSSFIELSELENIHFQNLENDFFIRNNALVIPQMDVRSSAADLTVNGRHTFDNNYEYHVKILLSQILSKKRKSVKRTVTEFGAVQDDGLGRTSLLLKVENKGEEVKVSYDLKAVTQEVQKNIKAEKQSLKTILNEEYGWYDDETKPATPATATPAQKKSRFSITWEETDSVPPQKTVEEEKGFRNLFRKK